MALGVFPAPTYTEVMYGMRFSAWFLQTARPQNRQTPHAAFSSKKQFTGQAPLSVDLRMRAARQICGLEASVPSDVRARNVASPAVDE